MWYPENMDDLTQLDIPLLFQLFSSSITEVDCGEKCSVYNANHIPFCCDIRCVVPSAYPCEWEHLKNHTELWRTLEKNGRYKEIINKLPENQVPLICLGYQKCQRNFRTLSCRSFPFFPYIDHQGKFIGLSYYWEYQDRCWIINHLSSVTPRFRDEFVAAYQYILERSLQEYANFRHQSIIMRRVFGRMKRAIPLISREPGSQLKFYKITPRSGRMRRVDENEFGKYGYYYYAEKLPFPGE